MNEKFLSPYNAHNTEERIYHIWKNSGFFNPDAMVKAGLTDSKAKSFSIVLPPPNVTGQLHLGHVFENATQDAIIRFNRMLGKKTLWIPGTDHAAIATQSKFEKELYKNKKYSRHDFNRDEFFDMIQEFALKNQTNILMQLEKIGSSLDWSRLCFTLDDKRQEAVFEAFLRMYKAGLIYQKHRIVNWDPKGQTTISDDEVVHVEQKGTMYTFKYSHDFPFPIATTRPETKLGDTAVAVHPDDPRYKEYIGKEYICFFAGESITLKIIADEYVNSDFGVGALGVTPAHSQADWDIAERHQLPIKQVINEHGKMMCGKEGVIGVKTTSARKAVVMWLHEEGLLEKEEFIDQNISTAERTGAVIEPLPKLQWWIDVNKIFPYPHESLKGIKKGQNLSLKDLMLHVINTKQINITPEKFSKIYKHWVTNLRDWNISRQINYGHRIPLWYKDDEMKISKDSPGKNWIQDPDTLDTWFSSALWSFSTLGWPNNTKDLKQYHPTNLLNPGYEILPLWVSRMILMTTFLIGDIPFKTASIHGVLRDKQGIKFSKSLNNGINPLEIMEQYGTDALRMSLIVGTTPGQDVSFDLQKVKAYKKFANKLWNITRFVLIETEGINTQIQPVYTEKDQKYKKEQQIFIEEITKEMKENRYYLASEKIYHYIWHIFADNILEESKEIFEQGDKKEILSRKQFLRNSLKKLLILLHPFMPFITEEIWQEIKNNHDRDILMTEQWPIL